jgi:thiol-disulfide isomerase/thioredoxin
MRSASPRLALLAAALALVLAACTSDADPGGGGSPAGLPSASATPEMSAGGGAASHPPEASTAPSESQVAGLTSDPLHTVVLRDVRTGSEFTLGQLAAEKPVLLETMAIWCSSCRAQMHRVVEAHALADFHSVGIDVDASEIGADLKAYVEDQGFDWPFAMADAELAAMLRDRFGNLVLNPPSTPMAILFPDGSIRPLDFGGYSVEALVAELTAG